MSATPPKARTRQALLRRLFATSVGAVLLAALAVPSAQAATYTYANALSTPMGAEPASGTLSSITGGTAEVALGFGSVTIATFYPAPGYSEVARGTSSASSVARISHDRANNAQSKCSWRWENVGGNADLTCAAIY